MGRRRSTMARCDPVICRQCTKDTAGASNTKRAHWHGGCGRGATQMFVNECERYAGIGVGLAWQRLHSIKVRRVVLSFTRLVSKLLHIWHWTYASMYFFTTDSICFGVKRPLNVSLPSGSREQATASSALKYDMTCSIVRCILLHTSLKLTNTVFFEPSLAT